MNPIPPSIPESKSLADLTQRLTGRPSSIEPPDAKRIRRLTVMAQLAAGQRIARANGDEHVLRELLHQLCLTVTGNLGLSEADAAIYRDAAFAAPALYRDGLKTRAYHWRSADGPALDHAADVAAGRIQARLLDPNPWASYRTVRIELTHDLAGWCLSWRDSVGAQYSIGGFADQNEGLRVVRGRIDEQLAEALTGIAGRMEEGHREEADGDLARPDRFEGV